MFPSQLTTRMVAQRHVFKFTTTTVPCLLTFPLTENRLIEPTGPLARCFSGSKLLAGSYFTMSYGTMSAPWSTFRLNRGLFQDDVCCYVVQS